MRVDRFSMPRIPTNLATLHDVPLNRQVESVLGSDQWVYSVRVE
jgi:hypothetical protein